MSARRLTKELKLLTQEPVPGCSITLPNEDDLYKWIVHLIGPENTPYEGGIFIINIKFTNDYPFKKPVVTFETKIYHPHISDKGQACLAILGASYSPAIFVKRILKEITTLLCDHSGAYIAECPCCGSVIDGRDLQQAMNRNILKEYVQNRQKFNRVAKQWTQQYAQGVQLVRVERSYGALTLTNNMIFHPKNVLNR